MFARAAAAVRAGGMLLGSSVTAVGTYTYSTWPCSPTTQRRGLGDTILGALLTKIHYYAPAGAYVSLMADPPGRRLYERHGFAATAPQSIGMAQILG